MKILGWSVLFVALACALVYLVERGYSDTPVRYRWDSGTKCIVHVTPGVWRECDSYTAEELNEFRLDWSEPKGYTKK